MSLTTRIKRESAQVFTASDGAQFLIQKVDRNSLMIETGMMIDLMEVNKLDVAEGDSENEVLRMLEGKTREESQSILRGMFGSSSMVLKAGLVGERVPHPSDPNQHLDVVFRWVDKPAFELLEGEINIALIPDDLKTELVTAIGALGKPPVSHEVATRFPEQ